MLGRSLPRLGTILAVLALPLLTACDVVLGHPAPLPEQRPISGPLHVSPDNPRYFAAPDGGIVYLTGVHTWNNLQDAGPSDPPPTFDYAQFLDLLTGNGLNFMRLWRWEQTRWTPDTPEFWYDPSPYPRTGPGQALDGKPKFDVSRFNQAYFDRMRERVAEAGRRGIYVSVMLFDGWSIEDKGFGPDRNPWRGHPFNRDNNVNGIDGDPDGDGMGLETHSLSDSAVVALQEAYARKVIQTVNDLDNVLYEISNESRRASTEWEYHMIAFVKREEAALPKQHPVGMTAAFPDGQNGDLLASPADWISPNAGDDDIGDPAAADGSKVILSDTDHLCGICAERTWVWETFVRGRNPVLMDVWRGDFLPGKDPKAPEWPRTRANLGYARAWAQRLDMARMKPRDDLASTGFALADPDGPSPAYVVYLVEGGEVTVDLSGSPGTLQAEWLSPRLGRVKEGDAVQGGAKRVLRSPFPLGDAVLLLH